MIYLLSVNYYSTNLIARLIASLPASPTSLYQVVVVNNSPDDQTLHQLQAPSLQILEAKSNLGFGKACNLGLSWIYQQDPHAFVWLLNPDTYLPPNTLEKVPAFFDAYPELSILSTLIYTTTGEIWFAGGQFIPQRGAILSTNLLASHTEAAYVPCDWVSGCSLLLNLRHFPQCPEFDPAYFLYYEDFDFCRRYAMQGHHIAVTPQIAIVHEAGAIANRNLAQKLQHSTYSYLLTLERYTNPLVFWVRFFRVTLYALILLGIKPQLALGKLAGVSSYVRRSRHHLANIEQ